jgi:hypothetical protein
MPNFRRFIFFLIILSFCCCTKPEEGRATYEILRNNSIRGAIYYNNQLITEAIYHINSDGSRYTPSTHQTVPKKHYALFFGCSYTFGWVLNDNQTMPYFFSDVNPEYKAYNYSKIGWGIHNILDYLLKNNLRQRISEPTGFAVYCYIPCHVTERVIGKARWLCVNEYLWEDPCFVLEAPRHICYKGKFKDNTFYYLFCHLFNKFNLINKCDYPKTTSKTYALATTIIEAIHQEYYNQFNNNNFLVIIYPGSAYDPQSNTLITKALENYNIPVLDYSNLIKDKSKINIPYDQHPSAYTNRSVARQLQHDLPYIHFSKKPNPEKIFIRGYNTVKSRLSI